jgi:hypothetical protein
VVVTWLWRSGRTSWSGRLASVYPLVWAPRSSTTVTAAVDQITGVAIALMEVMFGQIGVEADASWQSDLQRLPVTPYQKARTRYCPLLPPSQRQRLALAGPPFAA